MPAATTEKFTNPKIAANMDPIINTGIQRYITESCLLNFQSDMIIPLFLP